MRPAGGWFGIAALGASGGDERLRGAGERYGWAVPLRLTPPDLPRSIVRWSDGTYEVSVEHGQQGREVDLYWASHDGRGDSVSHCLRDAPRAGSTYAVGCGSTTVYVGCAPAGSTPSASVPAGAVVEGPYWLLAVGVGTAGELTFTNGETIDLAAVKVRRIRFPRYDDDIGPAGAG